MYEYTKEREKLFTEKGQVKFLAVRDHTRRLIDQAGAVTMGRAIAGDSGHYWLLMACVDRMVELGELSEVDTQGGVPWRHRVFVKG